jgi:hypothetical protein
VVSSRLRVENHIELTPVSGSSEFGEDGAVEIAGAVGGHRDTWFSVAAAASCSGQGSWSKLEVLQVHELPQPGAWTGRHHERRQPAGQGV